MFDIIFSFLEIKNTYFFLFLVFISFFVLIKFSSYFYKSSYNAVQKIHHDDTPRLGGIGIFLGLVFCYLLIDLDVKILNVILDLILFSSLIIIPTVIEDITHRTSPLFRFFFCFIAAISFFYFTDYALPNIDLLILSDLLKFPLFSILFYSFATVSIMNGFNLIDGTNGLSASTCFAGFSCLLFLSVIVGNSTFAFISVIFLLLILVFLFFNYPYGKIFLGDSGAYFLGFVLSCSLIIFFGTEDNVSPWNAILILFYPIIETIFSFTRKLFFEKTSPFDPDKYHLHLKIYFLMKDSDLIKRKKDNNNLVLPFLFVVWGTPLLIIHWVYEHETLIWLSIFIMSIGYIIFYRWIPNTLKK